MQEVQEEQVVQSVQVYLDPPVTGSTMCLFSIPEVNADTLPSLGSTVRFTFTVLHCIQLP